LTVSEFQNALLDDIAGFLRRVVEEDLPYKHNSPEFSDCDRKNAASHLRSLLFSNSVVLPVCDGELVLGQFQSVILAEMDGPRERSLKVQFLGE
jgi:secondary thiamine-phosphate synthase enzyme